MLLHAAAYWLFDTLWRWQKTDVIARVTLETLRLRMIKISGWVWYRRDRVRLRLDTSCTRET